MEQKKRLKKQSTCLNFCIRTKNYSNKNKQFIFGKVWQSFVLTNTRLTEVHYTMKSTLQLKLYIEWSIEEQFTKE
ncbi:hypothetical protein BLOT_008891 [Blomia tropicalis]|nr:hypothetical protein BLOT_008891 [Blomia tropicalis]